MENRVIKFRAWDSIQNMMVNEIQSCYDGVFDKNINHPQYGSVSCFEEFLRPFDEEQKKFHEYHIMEFTGKNDINKNEIYEGDIVENVIQESYLGHLYEVVWNQEYALFQLLDKDGKSSNIPLCDPISFKIIGNIYQNPELMDKNSRKN